MPKAKGKRIPRAKKTSNLVEDKKKKIRSCRQDSTAHSPAHPLYPSSINSWPESKNQHGIMPREEDIHCKTNIPRKCEKFREIVFQ